MLFSSLMFLFIFLPAVLFSYFIVGKRFKNFVLLMFSLFFYGYGGPKFLLLMLVSIFINYIFGLLVDWYRDDKIKVRMILTFSVLANLSFIGYYKYTNFFIQNVNNLFEMKLPMSEIIMPIGISFFTFQGLSYVIDIYREHGKVQKNPLNVALYISLFPQLIAGPIVRYETVAEQITEREETVDKFASGLERFIIGLSKKVLISNSMGLMADQIFGMQFSDISVLLAWIGALTYTAQIYFDFSGYSDMAIGLGRMFGFEFLENFNYPYISTSVTEFWRRWHISLSTWFRDYVYIPLGGNRVNTLKHLRNIFIVWCLTGLWHGASWNFIAWGLYFGIILTLEKFLLASFLDKLWKPIQHLYTMLLVVLGWVLFRAENLSYAVDYLKVMFGIEAVSIINNQSVYYLSEYSFELMMAVVFSMPVYPYIKQKFQKRNTKEKLSVGAVYVIQSIILLGMFLIDMMYLINSTFNPFIYFRF